MAHLRDSLLSSLPRDTLSTATIDHAHRDQEGTRQSVARGESKEVRDMAFNGVDSLEGHIHPLWYMYYELGKAVSSESPEHEGLVPDILRIQGMGPLTRPARGVHEIDIARTVDGTLWNDPPFLVGDMTNFWINPATLCTKQFEVFHLLPAAVAWLKIASHNLLLLSEMCWNDFPSHISKGKAKEANEKSLEKLATDGIQYIISTVKQRNSEILRAYKNGGNALHQDKHLSCLKPLARVEEPES
ncbi:hypothetical protein BDV27DRAFT_143485 [Aspergillus caelatus]|uniref:Uncharacterized protein n=1 Tax=Aspergillus caelatus TaxID=61420 RepID=A0A5N7ADA9_9EURO|nr:uncharacterized protein BDV27DRAFT_143485 [Aspergillus caelatus]KAE8366620.1 hypothetical protein BDV27DRAFT_143485 [Aspergillus caelatus]